MHICFAPDIAFTLPGWQKGRQRRAFFMAEGSVLLWNGSMTFKKALTVFGREEGENVLNKKREKQET